MAVEKMTLCDVVMRLNGSIEPIGETETDDIRFENLKDLTTLVSLLIAEINRVSVSKSHDEYSMKRAGKYAEAFLAEELGIKRE